METIKFKRENLAKYKTISTPGKYELEVASNVSEKNRITDEDGKNPRYIVNLRAVANDKLPQLRELFKDQEEVEIEETNGLFLTGNIWERDGQKTTLPMKGEKVDCAVDTVTSREGEEVLRVVNMRVNPSAAPEAISLDTFFAEVSEEEKEKANELTHA